MPQDYAPPAIPADESGLVFREPWETRGFVVMGALHQAGHSARPEWVATISARIQKRSTLGIWI